MKNEKTAIKFEIGKTYNTAALYGGFLFIEIVNRIGDYIEYKFDDDDKTETAKVEIYETAVFNKELEIMGYITAERVIAWEYHSPYADENDIDYGYFSSFDNTLLYTAAEYAEMKYAEIAKHDYKSFDHYKHISEYAVRAYKKNGNGDFVAYVDSFIDAQIIRTKHGLSIGLEPEPSYKDFSYYPTIWKWSETRESYIRLLGF